MLRVGAGIFFAVLIGVFFVFHLDHYLTFEALHENDKALRTFAAEHPLLAPTAYVAAYTIVVALSVPGATIMTIAGGLAFGLWRGAMLAVCSATAGAILLFLLARFLAGDTLRTRAGPFLRRMADGFHHNAFTYMVFLRLVPAFPFWAVNLVPALIGVRLQSFAAATLVGIIPGTLAYASLGDGLGRYFSVSADVPLSVMFDPKTIALRLGLALLALLPIAIRWIRKKS